MNEIMRELFRHSAWATGRLLGTCRDLSNEQLTIAYAGSYGSILGTFNHLIAADASYLNRLSGGERADWIDGDETADFDTLASWTDESAQGWEQFLSREVDGKRILQVDHGTYDVHASIVIAQAIMHANIHREQICFMLTLNGIEPPDLQPWEYAWDTGQIWRVKNS
jgi:uncharacterized damage-inducible protein DinB